MQRTELLKRLAVAGVVALLIIAGTAVVSVANLESDTKRMENPEYAPNSLVTDPIQNSGTVAPNVTAENSSGVVLIDRGYMNNVEQADIGPLVQGLTAAGHTVRYHEAGEDLSEELEGAKAYVVMTPRVKYSDTDVEALKQFTDRGGRLLLVSEPTTFDLVAGPLGGLAVQKQSSRVTRIAAAHGFAFDTRYLYNLETTDGNYKHVIAKPGPNAPLDGVNRTTIYTGTTVSVRNGTTLLVTTANTRLSDGGSAGRYAVAARSGNAVALGDRTMLRADRHAVADNEEFLAYLVRFLAGGETQSEIDVESGNESESTSGDPTELSDD